MNQVTTRIVLTLVCVSVGWAVGTYGDVFGQKEMTLSAETNPVLVPAKTRPVDISVPKMTAIPAETEIMVPEDGWITSFKEEVHGAPESSLRYGWLFDASTPDPYCPRKPGRVVFVMSLEKIAQSTFAPGYGYFVKKGDVLKVYGGFANLSDEDYAEVSFSVTLGFTPVSSGDILGNAYPLFLNAECDSLFVLPAHATHFVKELSKPFTIPIDGRIVLLGSHGHDFATDMLLTLNGKELWKTSPVHLPDGRNLGNPVYLAPFNGVPVKKGDELDLIQTSSNQTNKPSPAMSSMYIHILPADIDGATIPSGPHM